MRRVGYLRYLTCAKQLFVFTFFRIVFKKNDIMMGVGSGGGGGWRRRGGESERASESERERERKRDENGVNKGGRKKRDDISCPSCPKRRAMRRGSGGKRAKEAKKQQLELAKNGEGTSTAVLC